MDTECISRASRALAAVTLVRQAAPNEVAVPPGAEYETWIDEHRINFWAMAGWVTVVIMTCCILMGLVLLWWKSGRVAERIDSGTQRLEEGRCSQKCTYENHGHETRKDPRTAETIAPLLLKSHVSELVLSLRSKRRFRKARLEAAHWVLRTSVEPQSVLYQFPDSQIPVPQLYT